MQIRITHYPQNLFCSFLNIHGLPHEFFKHCAPSIQEIFGTFLNVIFNLYQAVNSKSNSTFPRTKTELRPDSLIKQYKGNALSRPLFFHNTSIKILVANANLLEVLQFYICTWFTEKISHNDVFHNIKHEHLNQLVNANIFHVKFSIG